MPVAYHPVEKAREQGVSFCETFETTEMWKKSMYQNLVLLSKLIFYIREHSYITSDFWVGR